MKIVRYIVDGKTEYGILDGERVQSLAGDPFQKLEKLERYHKLGDVKLLAPCVPSKIVAIGLNYHSHAKEVGQPVPKEPMMFFKPSTSVIGPEDKIVNPGCQRLDYEAELGVVIGKRASKVAKAEALNYVLGYTCFNDVTARDWQAQDSQWSRAKGSDTFAPIGPCIETELDAGNVLVEAYLNGERKQQANTSDLIFSVPELVSYISQVITLLPGDVIATGTPAGIGPMKSGDVIEIKVAGIGTLRNHIA
ncbi:MAG TPA: fumarylacetoacetate hydrolase family protein [Dehalococcoidia bacterium]|jgi:2-keto-4-pentenoate hydratase/2-oxohepta-3-ene-1,7-dioic acid hydratase in catechol pathway|nr:fumarylacetoacetate hydrolase family protein [Dehalococcoidia bacterium]